VELLCGIACKETASMRLGFIDRGLTFGEVLGPRGRRRSGDFPNAARSAFPKDTATFRVEFGDELADMLITEAYASRAVGT
jgi:hypothetical protein